MNPDEPEPATLDAAPPPPAWLLKEAKAEWNRRAEELVRTGVLTVLDTSLFAIYCQLWARFVQGERRNKPLPAPLIARLHSLANEFGIGAVGRARSHATPKAPEQDDLEKLRNRGNRNAS